MVISPETIPLLTCISPFLRQISWKEIPFGVKQSSALFQIVLIRILYKDFIRTGKSVISSSDIAIISGSKEEHQRDLNKLSEVLQAAGPKLSLRQVCFYQQEFDHLAFRITKKGLMLTDNKVKAIKEFEKPTTIAGVQRYLGIANVCSKFIARSSDISAALSYLARGTNKSQWTPLEEEALQRICGTTVSKAIVGIRVFIVRNVPTFIERIRSLKASHILALPFSRIFLQYSTL